MVQYAIPASALSLEEHAHRHWAIKLPAGTEYKQVLKQDAWKHFAFRFRPGDLVRVTNEDASYYAELFVRACDRTWAQMFELRFIDFDAPAGAAGAEDHEKPVGGLEVRWGGAKGLWGVYRVSDGERLQGGMQTKLMAQEWLADHARKTAA